MKPVKEFFIHKIMQIKLKSYVTDYLAELFIISLKLNLIVFFYRMVLNTKKELLLTKFPQKS